MGPAYNVAGDWMLSVSSNGATTTGPGAISTAGLALFFEPSSEPAGAGDTAILPAITGGSNCFSGLIYSYDTPATGGNTGKANAQGSINSATSISGSFQNTSDGTTGTFALAPNSPLTGSVTALTGSGWLGEIEGATTADILQITLTASGTNSGMTLQGTDGTNCTVSGTFTQEGGNASTLNVFDVSITYTGTSCSVTGTQTGLGFETNSDYFAMNGSAAGTYLYAIPSGSATVLEIYKPSGM